MLDNLVLISSTIQRNTQHARHSALPTGVGDLLDEPSRQSSSNNSAEMNRIISNLDLVTNRTSAGRSWPSSITR